MKMKKIAGFALTMSLAISSLGMSVYAASEEVNDAYIAVKEMDFTDSRLSAVQLTTRLNDGTEVRWVEIRDYKDDNTTLLTIEGDDVYFDEETGAWMISKSCYEGSAKKLINENKVVRPAKIEGVDNDKD